jgi:aminoglycoside 3-N-acetyltransferase I
MKDRPIIRRLTDHDIRHLRALIALFGRAFAAIETYGARPPSDGYIRQLLNMKHIIVLVALADDTVVGGLVAYELEKFERERREIYIYDLAVEATHRRQGIASALIDKLGEIAAQREAWVIYVQADYGDVPAIRLYEKLGVREDVMHFDIGVPKKS